MIPAQRFQNEVHESTRWHGLTFAAGPLPISQQHAALRRGMRDFRRSPSPVATGKAGMRGLPSQRSNLRGVLSTVMRNMYLPCRIATGGCFQQTRNRRIQSGFAGFMRLSNARYVPGGYHDVI